MIWKKGGVPLKRIGNVTLSVLSVGSYGIYWIVMVDYGKFSTHKKGGKSGLFQMRLSFAPQHFLLGVVPIKEPQLTSYSKS